MKPFLISKIRALDLFRVSHLGFRISILGCLSAVQAAEKITYDDHIFPILESSCLNCHNPDKKKGGLDLSTYTGALAGGSGGKVALAGDGASSKIYATTIHTEEPVMPPEGEKLSKKQTELIRAWVDGGLLENKSSRARKPKKPRISLTATGDPQAKPEGPLPMPQDLLLEPVLVPPRATVVNDMEASPWAPLLAITGQRQILLYHTDHLELVGVLPFPKGTPETISFHPSGKHLLAGGGIGGKSGTTITWNITTGEVLMTMGKEFDSIIAADLRADMGGIALGGPSRLIKLWDTQSAEQIKKIKKHTDWVTALAYSPDGVLLATGDRNNGIQVWESHTGNEFHNLRGHKKGIVDLKWRADSNLLASASEDGQIFFWDMNQGKQVKKTQAHRDGILAMDYARDGQLITSGRDRRVKIWKPDLGLKKELPAFEAEVTEVEFSHDSKRFFTADWNGEIQVWDTATFKKIGTLNSNPPTIETRLAQLHIQTTTFAEALAKARSAIPQKEKELKNAQKGFAWIQKILPEKKKKRDTLKQDIAHQENLRKQFDLKSKELKPLIQELEARFNDYRSGINDLQEKRKQVIATLNQARTEKVADRIAASEKQLKEQDDALAKSRTEVDRLMIELKKKREEYHAATQKQTEAYKAREARQKELQHLNAEFPKLEKQLVDAKKGLEWTQKSLAKAKEHITASVKNEANHQRAIKRWEAAQINTTFLQTTKKATQAAERLDALRIELHQEAQAGSIEQVRQLKEKVDQSTQSLLATQKEQRKWQQSYQTAKDRLSSSQEKRSPAQ